MGLQEQRIEQARRQLGQLRPKLARASKTIADERAKAARERDRARKASNDTTRRSVERSAEQAEARANKAEQDRARLDHEIAKMEAKLAQAQSALDKERAKAEERRIRDLEARIRSQLPSPAVIHGAVSLSAATPPTRREWDLFISHASPDKGEFVGPLAELLSRKGARVWFDDFEISWGDSLRSKIDEGLARSRYGVVVITPAYLAGRRWTEEELNGLFAANKRILPIWHRVTQDEVASYSPMLADRVALSTAIHSMDRIVSDLMDLLEPNDSQE